MKKTPKYKLDILSGLNIIFHKKENLVIGRFNEIRTLKTAEEDLDDSVLLIEAISAILPDKNLAVRTPLWAQDFKRPSVIMLPWLFLLELYDSFISALSFILYLFGLKKALSDHQASVRRVIQGNAFRQFQKQLKKDGLKLIDADFLNLMMTYTMNKDRLAIYIESLANYGPPEPEYLMAFRKEIETGKQLKSLIDFVFLRENAFINSDIIMKENWHSIDKILDPLQMIGFLFEGYFWFYARNITEEEIIKNLQVVCKKHHLTFNFDTTNHSET